MKIKYVIISLLSVTSALQATPVDQWRIARLMGQDARHRNPHDIEFSLSRVSATNANETPKYKIEVGAVKSKDAYHLIKFDRALRFLAILSLA